MRVESPFRLLDEITPPPMREWLPASIGLLTGLAATWLVLPASGSAGFSALGLWFLAARCTIPVLVSSALAFWLSASVLRTHSRRAAISGAIDVGCLATWVPALLIFFRNRSWLAAIIAAALAAIGARAVAVRSSPADSDRSLSPALAIGILLQTAALAIVVKDWRACALAAAAAACFISWTLTSRNVWTRRPGRLRKVRIVPAILLGIGFSAGGLSPSGGRGNGAGNGHGSLFDLLRGAASADSADRNNGNKPGAVVIGQSYPGVILWPDTEKHVTLVVPLAPAPRTLFTAKTIDELSIPFYGAYYFYKASGPPPPNSFVTRGDPVALTFRSTDEEPLAMDARQNFGRLIDVSCCSSIAILIRNGDHRKIQMAMELILTDTSTTGKPSGVLGPVSVPPAATDHGATEERLTFPIRPAMAIRQFDEITVHLLRSWPEADRSARIAVRRFVFTRRF